MNGDHKILLVNKFYYARGGDCIVTMNTEALLKAHGYDVAVYAMQYSENVASPWSKYFAANVSFSGGGLSTKLAAMKRVLGMGDIVESFNHILDDFKPQVVHLNNIHSYLSPVLAKLAHNRGCKVVWTMHDYKLLCPSYSCTRNGKPCELCFSNKMSVLTHKCMKGSLAASAIACVEALKWNRKRLQQWTDCFICPSQFMASKMAEGGFDSSKLAVVPNAVDQEKIEFLRQVDATMLNNSGNYYCYIGRLSSEKGVATLLEAASTLPFKLMVAGDGPLSNELRGKYAACEQIEFLGRINAQAVMKLVLGARLSVIPSEWYENNPLGVIESLCAGTPVVGANIGGIPELINQNNGAVFESGNAQQLQQAITTAWNASWDCGKIQADALHKYSPQQYISQLEKIYAP